MMRLLLFAIVLIFTSLGLTAQVVDEDLRGGSAPAGWAPSDISFETASGGYARFDESSSSLVTAPFSVGPGATLTFDVAKWGSGTNGPLTVEASDDGGTTFSATSFVSPTPSSSSYLSAFWVVPVSGTNVVLRFTRASSLSRKRLRDVVVIDNNPLPVTLTAFNAKATTSGAMLEWSTASEYNNDYFAVEMSRDAASFNESAQVKGNGTTESFETYAYEYNNLAAGTYYFRLRQVDFDGQSAYSDVVSLTIEGRREFTMVSNVVLEVVEVDVTTPRPTYIMNMAGSVLAEFTTKEGRNNLDVSGLPNGMYILSDGVNAKRFVK